MKNLALLGFCLALFSTQWSAQRDVDVQKLEKAISTQKVASKGKYLVLNIDKDLSEEAPISENRYGYDRSRREEEALKPSKIYVSPNGVLSTYDWHDYSQDFTTTEEAAEYIEKYRVKKATKDEEEAKRIKRAREDQRIAQWKYDQRRVSRSRIKNTIDNR